MSYTNEQAQAHYKAREAAGRLAYALEQAADKTAELDKLAGQAPDPLKGLEKGLEGHVTSGVTYTKALKDLDDEGLERRLNTSKSFVDLQRVSLTQARNTLREARKNVAAVAKAAEKLEAWLEARVKVSELALAHVENELEAANAEAERRAAEREANRPMTVAEIQAKLEELERRQREYTDGRVQAAE